MRNRGHLKTECHLSGLSHVMLVFCLDNHRRRRQQRRRLQQHVIAASKFQSIESLARQNGIPVDQFDEKQGPVDQ